MKKLSCRFAVVLVSFCLQAFSFSASASEERMLCKSATIQKVGNQIVKLVHEESRERIFADFNEYCMELRDGGRCRCRTANGPHTQYQTTISLDCESARTAKITYRCGKRP